jgi:hypothetical protein
MYFRPKGRQNRPLGEKGGDEEAEKVTLSLLFPVFLLTGVMHSMRVLQGTDVLRKNEKLLKKQD